MSLAPEAQPRGDWVEQLGEDRSGGSLELGSLDFDINVLDIDLKPSEYEDVAWIAPDDDDEDEYESQPQEGLVPPIETFAVSPAQISAYDPYDFRPHIIGIQGTRAPPSSR